MTDTTASKGASHLAIVLARFDDMRVAEPVSVADPSRVLFRGVGADTRAAATEPGSGRAFRFTVLSLHADEASAHESVENRLTIAPWIAAADEIWAAVLLPFRHLGECNYIDQTRPGPLFASVGAQPAPAEPIAIVTTSGWALGPALDMARVSAFSSGVLGVRASMTAVDGLHSQQSFFFPGALQHDPLTFTLWRDSASARAFAYGPGVHKAQMQRQREHNLADRTSFTRCRIVRSEGTWHGRDPLAW